MVDVRIGIVSWNTSRLLDACLGALPAALGDLDADVVVVDNGSSDDSVAVARSHPGVRVDAVGENLGYARGMNRALAGSEAAFLVALNPDTVPAPGSLHRLVDTLRSHPDLGVAVPRLVDPAGTEQHSVHRFPSLQLAAVVNLLPVPLLRGRLGRRFCVPGAPGPTRARDIEWAIGAVHAMRHDVVGDVPYSERWFMYVEDLDLCWRVRRAGHRVRFDPRAEVTHVGNAAGEQRWGDARVRVWTEATYAWCRTELGPGRTRGYALLNLVGATSKGAWATLVGRAGHDPERSRVGRELRALVPVHGRAVLGRPAPAHRPS